MKNSKIKNNDSLAPCGKESLSGRTLLPKSGTDAPTVLSAVYTDSTLAKNRQADVPQYGRSMIEMLGVLAIIGVLSVGGIAGYSKAMMKYRINKTIEQITLIAGNMRTFFASQPAATRYDGFLEDDSHHDSLNIISKAHLVPDEMFNPEGEIACDGHCVVYITNAFGGPVKFHWSCGIDMDETGHCKNSSEALQISFQGIPQEACIDIASQDWSNLNPELIYINTALETVVNSGLRIKSVDDAITNCSSASDNTINFLIK